MADLFLGQTMTESYQFTSGGAAHTFEFNFPPDKVVFNNLSQWDAVAGNLPISVWFKDQTVTAHAFQMQVIVDNGVTADANFLDTAAAGFTVSDTPGGVPAFRALIAGVSLASICVVTTTAPHGFQTDQIVRITDLGDVMPVPRGMTELDGNRYLITFLSPTTFSLRDVITDDPIDSTLFEPWVSGGRCDIESRVISLNNPQQFPYDVIPYIPNPYKYDPVRYRLTVGTAVMGAMGNIFQVEVYKWGQVTVLGQLT